MDKFTDNLLDQITKKLVESIHPEKIYLFGSYAVGTPDQDSDIDLLAVVPDTDCPTREISIRGRLSLKDMAVPLDLIVCTRAQLNRYGVVKNTIMNEALYGGRLIYGS